MKGNVEMSRLDAEIYARNLLKELNINTYPINLKNIIETLGIEYQEKYFENNEFGGCLINNKDAYCMIINASCLYEARKCFTIAHELGHYWIPTHQVDSYKCLATDINNFLTKEEQELEANIFAAELLMPKEIFSKDISKLSPCMNSILKLSDKYGTSLTSTALRFVKLTLEPCAIIFSENGKLKWNWPSNNFNYEMLSELNKESYVYELFSNKICEIVNEKICSSFIPTEVGRHIYCSVFYFGDITLF